MDPHDLAGDGKAEACALTAGRWTTPETLERAFAVGQRNARSVVGNGQSTLPVNRNANLIAGWRVGDGIFDKIADRVGNRGGITAD
jgi:hypothetical protein